MKKSYVFYDKDMNLDLEEFGFISWLKYVHKKKTFTTMDFKYRVTTHEPKLRDIIRRLIGHGYIFRAGKEDGADFSEFADTKFNLKNLKLYTWAEVKEIYEVTTPMEKVG